MGTLLFEREPIVQTCIFSGGKFIRILLKIVFFTNIQISNLPEKIFVS